MVTVPLLAATDDEEDYELPLADPHQDTTGLALDRLVWQWAASWAEEEGARSVAAARAGATRDRRRDVVETSTRVLLLGAANEAVRHGFALDAKLTTFRVLQSIRPATWGRYPSAALPTREILAQVAAEVRTVGVGDAPSGWHAAEEARRQDLHSRRLPAAVAMVRDALHRHGHDR